MIRHSQLLGNKAIKALTNVRAPEVISGVELRAGDGSRPGRIRPVSRPIPASVNNAHCLNSPGVKGGSPRVTDTFTIRASVVARSGCGAPAEHTLFIRWFTFQASSSSCSLGMEN